MSPPPRYSAVAASSSTKGKNRVWGEMSRMPEATSATTMPTIRITITTGMARRRKEGGTTRGSCGGASTVTVASGTAGGATRRWGSKMRRLNGTPAHSGQVGCRSGRARPADRSG
ncbi:Uncharacterised protein [Mycobacteroides abscessus subsp. abscessus]|nr:Uncharacterised protein [Mycobacteroides abscessus subsp. abscessus]